MTTRRTRIAVLVLVALAAAAIVAGLAALRGEEGGPRGGAPTARGADVLAYDDDRREEFEQHAADGLAHVLHAKSPGGALATAQRTARWRGLIDEVAKAGDLDADLLEALVFLESAGRPDARASDDLEGAVGLTQILAETGTNLLDMRIDVQASERLTRGISRGRRVRARERLRRRVDERFDPRKALEGTARYLRFAREQLGRDDLALASYHMGVGNLQRVLGAYGDDDVSYARLFFDSSPLRHPAAHAILASLGDDSSTYLWRLHAARDIMAAWREDPDALAEVQARHLAKASAEEVLHPPDDTPRFADVAALAGARDAGDLVALDPERLAAAGLRLDPRIGELAPRDERALYRLLRPEALALLTEIGEGVREISGGRTPLTITSVARDEGYQRRLIRSGNGEATRSYSLHTTGWAFDIARDYGSRRQARAFQFWLDRLQALDLIAWVREPGAIHVTVSGRAAELL